MRAAGILLPLSKPVIATVYISSFVSTWNTYLWPMLVTNDNTMRTVQVGVTMLNFPDGTVYGPIMAASILVLLPTLLIFVIFQKKIDRHDLCSVCCLTWKNSLLCSYCHLMKTIHLRNRWTCNICIHDTNIVSFCSHHSCKGCCHK